MIGQKLRPKNCKTCKTKFKPTRNFQEACSVECAIKLGRIKEQKKADKAHREAKKNIKPMSHWLKLTQKTVNEFILLRDAELPCISCGTWDCEEFHAGHYRSIGAASHLRFNPMNIWRQCSKCNTHLSGNIEKYRENLVNRIGLSAVELLENNNLVKTWSREELDQIRRVYRANIRESSRKKVVAQFEI